MKITEHLTENQLTEYFGNAALEGEMKHAIGRHLLLCDFCLKRLPQPTPEQFLAALMTENETEESGVEKIVLSERVGFIAQFLTEPKIFALSAVALALVFVFSIFIWLNAAKSSDTEKEVAENFEIKDTQAVLSQTDDNEINLPPKFPTAQSDKRSSSVSTRATTSNRDSLATNNGGAKQNSKTASRNNSNVKTQMKIPDEEKASISLTRGGNSAKCGDQMPLDWGIEMSGETLVLKWKKVPNAAKYHLYVSDDEEILVDEYETERETSYALKKQLDPMKTYKWKVIITLENGNTIVGESQKFSPKDFRQNQKKSDKKKKFDVRCSANN